MSTATFSYDTWSALLADIVSPDGKADYPRLAERRDGLDRFIAELAAVSPESHPDAFTSDEDRLAYWINAYNAFTLHAIIAEYPISSVWKTRDGQFFQRRQHVAGGRAVSLDEIEHTILRGQFGEPRIHFAINCGSNGCPPLRPAAYEGADLRDTLRSATEQFLASEWNCRVDHATRRIFISRLFKMYAEDFAGEHGSTRDYREGVLRFVAQHTGASLDDIGTYEVVYNVYDWGLNDANRQPHLGPILFHEPVEHYTDGDQELRELHLYEGNFCNRTCTWCTINGSPDGWYANYSRATLDQAAATVATDGNIKFYGGEPTLHAGAIIDAMGYLRKRGFRGLFTIFSNGVKAERLIDILESDARSEAVLNYSIYHGRDAEPLPPHAQERLEAWAHEQPNRIFQGYKVLFHAGAGSNAEYDRDRESDFHGLGTGCVRCFPVLTSRGRFHACPFAAEVEAPHYDLGRVGAAPRTVLRNYRTFRRWVDTDLDPSARARGISSCEMCHKHLQELTPPPYESQPNREQESTVDLATVDHLLTTTRSVRKRLDFTRTVDLDVLRRCIDIAFQAPTGSNAQGWHFMVVTDAAKRAGLAALYRRAFEGYRTLAAGAPQMQEADPRFKQTMRIVDSASYLAEHLHEAPVMVVPCIEGRIENAGVLAQASVYGSILPAVWSLMLALRSRGIGSAWTTLHLMFERDAAALLAIPDSITQTALLPVAYFTGTDFKPAKRLPSRQHIHWNSWGRHD